MALTLIATAGASNANSYCTVAEANTYYEKRLHKDDWTNASTTNKTAALVWATRILDEQVDWHGYKRSSAQPLRWPRSHVYDVDGYPVTSSAIPTWLKEAVAEFALHLIIEDRTLETNRDTKGFKQMEVGDLKIVLDAYTGKPVMPPAVWSMIKFYCSKIGKSKTLERM